MCFVPSLGKHVRCELEGSSRRQHSGAMPRRTHKGGTRQLQRVFEDANKTGEGFAKYHTLSILKVEGKASCWLLSVLANIDGALQNPRHAATEKPPPAATEKPPIPPSTEKPSD